MNEVDPKAEQEQHLKRRDFLDRILAGWGMLALAPFFYGIVRYLLPVRRPSAMAGKVVVAQVGDLSLNSAKIIRVNDKPVMLIKTNSGQIKAMSARCTHLGCTVKFTTDQGGYLLCNCHGSRFDLNGRNLRGPASVPLRQFKVSIEEDEIALTSV